MTLLINPFVFGAAGYFEPIAQTTVGSGGSSSVSFSNIPSNFNHLQLRLLSRTDRSPVPGDYLSLTFNDSTSSIYNISVMGSDIGNGSVFGYQEQSVDKIKLYTSTSVSPYLTPLVLDILDYSNTTKNTAVRALSGTSTNSQTSGGYISSGVYFQSGLWVNTSSVEKITLTPLIGSAIQETSTFALYGIKE